MFTASRLTLARKRRGFTKVQLAEKAKVAVRSITDYESEKSEPQPETVLLLAKALRFPPEFFSAPPLPEVDAESTTFRALSKLTAIKREQAKSAATLALDFHRWITERFRLPELSLPDLGDEQPDRAAEILRMEWGLGEKPIPNMVHLLEAHGIRVFSLAEDYVEVDAFSTWDDGVPFVFLNTLKSVERSRMDAAHELGHLVLHRHGTTVLSRPIEEEAKRFASAFLMPRSGVLPAPHFPSLDQLMAIKRKWKVSLIALALRLHELGVITDWHYRSLCMDISRRGYRKKEPNPLTTRETSQLLQKVTNTMRDEGTSILDIARELCLPIQELNAFVSGFVTLPVEGPAVRSVTSAPGQPPKLEVVKGGKD